MLHAAWLHSFRVWTSHCLYLGLYLDYAYLYLRLYLRGTVHCLLAYCLVNPKKNWSPWWKLGGTAVKKPQVWFPLSLYRHVIIHLWPFDLSDLLWCRVYSIVVNNTGQATSWRIPCGPNVANYLWACNGIVFNQYPCDLFCICGKQKLQE